MTIEQHMPEVYDYADGTDISDLSAAIDLAVANASTDIDDFLTDLGVLTATGEGLNRTGANYDVARSPGMIDRRLAQCIQIIAGGRRCTIAIIKALLDAATGLNWVVKDRQHDLDENGGAWGIPLFEVWAQALNDSHNYGKAWAGFDTHIDGHPEESGLAGPVLDTLGKAGGRFNDHAWSPIDWWTVALLDRVRPAGIQVIFTNFYP